MNQCPSLLFSHIIERYVGKAFFLKFCVSIWTSQKCLTFIEYCDNKRKSAHCHVLISLIDTPSTYAREIRNPELKYWVFVKWKLNCIFGYVTKALVLLKGCYFFKRKDFCFYNYNCLQLKLHCLKYFVEWVKEYK